MNETQKRTSSIATKGVVPLPSGTQQPSSHLTSKPNPNVQVMSGKTGSGSVSGKENSNVRISRSSTGSGKVTSDPHSKTRGSTGESFRAESANSQPSDVKSRVQRTSQLASTADSRDKHGRTPKQKRREDFIVNSLTTVVLLGVVFGGLYYAYTVAMGILN